MAPIISGKLPIIVTGNGYSGNLSNIPVGIITTLFALGSFAFDYHELTDLFTVEYSQQRPGIDDILYAINDLNFEYVCICMKLYVQWR